MQAFFSFSAKIFFIIAFLVWCCVGRVGSVLGGKGGVEEGGVVLCLGMKGYDGGDMGSKSGGWVYR